jgi:hypothetical protein
MKRLRNLWNLLPTELDHGPTRFLFTILGTVGLAGLAILLEEHPSWRSQVIGSSIGPGEVCGLLRSMTLNEANSLQSGFDHTRFARLERIGRHGRWLFVPVKSGANCLAR